MQNLITISQIFSDKNRIDIFTLILRDKEVCVCEICDTLDIAQSLASRHLNQMKKAKIIDSRKEGKWSVYYIPKDIPFYLKCITDELREYLKNLPNSIKCERIIHKK